MKRPPQITVALSGLLLFLLFTLCMFLALILGANTYQGISNSLSTQFKERSCLNYVAEKIRHYDTTDSVALTELDGVNVLTLSEEIDGTKYDTRIYHYDGQVYELFAAGDVAFSLGDGIAVLEIDSLDFSRVNDALLEITCEEEGRRSDSFVTLQSEKA